MKKDRIKYYLYINSEQWKQKRRDFFASNIHKCYSKLGKWNCYCCEAIDVPLDLHHRSYKRLGNERISTDLIPVCRKCHNDIHYLLKKNKKNGWNLWGATKAIRKKRQNENRKGFCRWQNYLKI